MKGGETMILRTLTATALVAGVLLAQPAAEAGKIEPKDAEPKRSKETLALIDQARALPPEFCADILLTLAASPLIPDAKWRRELMEEAFLAGSHAQLPYERIAYGLAVDSLTNEEFCRQGLERLTLQTRAIDAMFEIDPQRAWPCSTRWRHWTSRKTNARIRRRRV